jgi:GNAT superfamily N-acetyltransferase
MTGNLDTGVVGDLTAVADVINLSSREHRGPSMDYTPEFLSNLFTAPGDHPVIAPAYYDDGRLVAFVGGFPRRVSLGGNVRNLLLMTFFTVAPGYKRKGLGRSIWSECLRQARRAGYDGALHYCVDTNPSNAVTVAGAREAGFRARQMFTVPHLMFLPRRSRSAPMPAVDEPAMSDSVDRFLRAAASLDSQIPLKRWWNQPEAQSLHNRPGSIITTHPDGAALSGYIFQMTDTNRTRCFFLEDVLWDCIGSEERIKLLQRCMARVSGLAELVIVPNLQYADFSPFTAIGFRRSPRTLNVYLTLWEDSFDQFPVPCMYADVL